MTTRRNLVRGNQITARHALRGTLAQFNSHQHPGSDMHNTSDDDHPEHIIVWMTIGALVWIVGGMVYLLP